METSNTESPDVPGEVKATPLFVTPDGITYYDDGDYGDVRWKKWNREISSKTDTDVEEDSKFSK